jgi:Ca2+/H+ antiporter, TMEM165/GDT1 family
MNLEKVIFGFFILLAATLNFGFVYGDIDNPAHHHLWEFFAAIIVNLIATVLKFGDRTQIGAIHLASSLVALLQLIAASLVWFLAEPAADGGATPAVVASIVSLSAGALLANIVSVTIMIVETTLQRR